MTQTSTRSSCAVPAASQTPQKRYSIVELELLATAYAFKKCSYWLLGCPRFTMKIDHRPLVGLFTKQLHKIQNQGLSIMRERVFNIMLVEGKLNFVADLLSRQPAFHGNSVDSMAEEHACQKITLGDMGAKDITAFKQHGGKG